jgi:chorismate mutase
MAEPTSPEPTAPIAPSRDLGALRARIDHLDAALISIVAERLAVCREVAAVKQQSDTPVIQPHRVRDVVTSPRCRGRRGR